jgi:hypothetical protein
MKKLIALGGLVILAVAGAATPAYATGSSPDCPIVVQWC